MKKIQTILAILVVSMIFIASFAFTRKNVYKPFAPVTYYYKAGVAKQRLQPGITTGDAIEQSITQAIFTDATTNAKWSTNAVSFTNTCDMNAYIGSITFNEEATADGGGDGALTLQEALNAVWAAYIAPSPDLMPPFIFVDNVAAVVITAKTAATDAP